MTDDATAALVRYFTRDGETIGFVVEREPIAVTVRSVVMPAAPAPLAVVQVDTVEGLLVYPERLGERLHRTSRSRDTKFSTPPTFEM